jgi:hypothetical protein
MGITHEALPQLRLPEKPLLPLLRLLAGRDHFACRRRHRRMRSALDIAMKSASQIRSKVRLDLALNMTELSRASGYRRQTLALMNLPWQAGKLSLGDFRRIMRKRQDLHERNISRPAFLVSPGENGETNVTPLTATTGADHPMIRLVDKFDAPSRKRVKPAASHRPPESRLRGSAR